MSELDIVASAGHGEYGDFSPSFVTVIWDPLGDDDLCERIEGDEDAAKEIWAGELGWKGIAKPDGADLTWEKIVRVRGNRAEVGEWLTSLLGDLRVTPSGDDTTYDYWPSGVRLAREVAAVLGREDEVAATVASAMDGTGIDAEDLGV